MPTRTLTTARGAARRPQQTGASNALVLATVTALLKNLLENGMVDRGVTTNMGADTNISALPPDRVDTGSDEKPRLNLFLYQIRPRGLDYPSRYAPTDTRPDRLVNVNGSLCFELHYLVTAYGAEDLHLEVLLGYAIEMLHDTPILTGERIRAQLATLASTEGGRVVLPAVSAMATDELAGRWDQIKIVPQFLDREEMWNLWSIFQATYRPSAAYKLTVFLADDDPAERRHRAEVAENARAAEDAQ